MSYISYFQFNPHILPTIITNFPQKYKLEGMAMM